MTATKTPPLTAEHQATTAPAAPTGQGSARKASRIATIRQRTLNVVIAIGVIVLLGAMWEGYKALGQSWDDVVPGLGWHFPVATDDMSMPHLSSIFGALGDPANRADSTTLLSYLLTETMVTLQEALYGLLAGSALGFLLATVFLYIAPLRKGLMPWLVASQTVPLVAIAPMIVIWGGQTGAPPWVAVTGIAAYLAFFPVTINTLRGLRSPSRVHLELVRSVGANRRQQLAFLRIPSALPFVFAGLRLAATASVVGAIVGELSAGTGRGIGRAILTFAYYYSNGPEKLYAAVLVAAVAGILFVQVLAVAERIVLRNRHS